MINLIKAIFRIIDKIIFVLLMAIIVVFCINNYQNVTLSLKPLPFEIETKLFLVILLSFFLGVFISSFSSYFSLGRERFKNFVNSIKIGWLERKVKNNKKIKE